MSILLVEVWCWKEDGGGTAPGHQSGGGSAVLTDDFRCHQFPGSETEGGQRDAEGLPSHREQLDRWAASY